MTADETSGLSPYPDGAPEADLLYPVCFRDASEIRRAPREP